MTINTSNYSMSGITNNLFHNLLTIFKKELKEMRFFWTLALLAILAFVEVNSKILREGHVWENSEMIGRI